ncbi:MAG: class I SAM-dependent methyltransferase, partial [Patescibacteria group bacterium]|nr:class I SAM-dependent methyltransferase [Patescibacteria group bacterium]
DIETTLPYEDNTVDKIYCSHALEHCAMVAVPKMLKDWERVLTKGGGIEIIVPEIEACMRTFLEAEETDPAKWSWKIEYILGGQHHQSGQQLHKSAFTPTWLKALLERADLVVDKINIIHNGRNDCIHLNAHKKNE